MAKPKTKAPAAPWFIKRGPGIFLIVNRREGGEVTYPGDLADAKKLRDKLNADWRRKQRVAVAKSVAKKARAKK